jgi:hypothetical protein
MNNFRLYIDESGTHKYSDNDFIAERYLGLTGVIISSEANEQFLYPQIIELKRIVAEDTDELPILHREDIVNQKGCYAKLKDPSVRKEFDDQLLKILDEGEFVVCAVVLDKKSHLLRYQQSAFHPYHYCLTVLLERYSFYLESMNRRGDVMAEARGKTEDAALREAYSRFHQAGTYFRSPERVQAVLTSKEIKIARKEKRVPGLELADLFALATKLDVLQTFGHVKDLTPNFTRTIIEHVQSKYRRNEKGQVKGFGKKLIM